MFTLTYKINRAGSRKTVDTEPRLADPAKQGHIGKRHAEIQYSCSSALTAVTSHFFDKPIDLFQRQMEAT